MVSATRPGTRPTMSFARYLGLVRQSALGNNDAKATLHAAMGSDVSPGGKFGVPSDVRTTLMVRVIDDSQVISRCVKVPTDSAYASLEIPTAFDDDRSAPWAAKAYRTTAGDTRTSSRFRVGQVRLPASGLDVAVHCSNELMESGPLAAFTVQAAATEGLRHKLEGEIINGVGAGESIGVRNAGCTITVAKENAQSAATVVDANIEKMWARLWGSSMPNAVWLCNQKLFPQIIKSSYYDAATGTLLSKPVYPCEHCPAPGTAGDLILGDFSQYALPDRSISSISSLHFRFLNDEETFLVSWRVIGSPIWYSPVTPINGSDTQSPFVMLGARS